MKYQVYTFDGIGYQKLFHYQAWRVAMLNYIEELDINQLNYFECHEKTDEVFVLLTGRVTMFFADVKDNQIIHIEKLDLKPNRIYNIPAGVFHTHTLSQDAKLLIIEQEDTTYDNSPRIYFDEKTTRKIKILQGVK